MSDTAIFLRGINLGGRRVKSAELAAPFRDAGFARVRTYQASGNVVIDTPDLDPAVLESRVEDAIATSLGFEADAFARSLSSLAELVQLDPIGRGEADGFTPYVIFLKTRPEPDRLEALAALGTDDDRFPSLDREVVWLRRGRLSDSTVEQRHLERALGGAPNTMRKITTLRRMVARFGEE